MKPGHKLDTVCGQIPLLTAHSWSPHVVTQHEDSSQSQLYIPGYNREMTSLSLQIFLSLSHSSFSYHTNSIKIMFSYSPDINTSLYNIVNNYSSDDKIYSIKIFGSGYHNRV